MSENSVKGHMTGPDQACQKRDGLHLAQIAAESHVVQQARSTGWSYATVRN